MLLHVFCVIGNVMRWVALYYAVGAAFYYIMRKIDFFNAEEASFASAIWPVSLSLIVILSPLLIMGLVHDKIEEKIEDSLEGPQQNSGIRRDIL